MFQFLTNFLLSKYSSSNFPLLFKCKHVKKMSMFQFSTNLLLSKCQCSSFQNFCSVRETRGGGGLTKPIGGLHFKNVCSLNILTS